MVNRKTWISIQAFDALFPELRGLVHSLLDKNIFSIGSARICGSHFRGDNDQLSDIDLFIVVDDKAAKKALERGAKSINENNGARLAPNVFTYGEFERLCKGSFSPFLTLIDSMPLIDDEGFACAVFRGMEYNFYGIVAMELAEARSSFEACLDGKKLGLRDLAYLTIDAWRRVATVRLMLGDEPFEIKDIQREIEGALGQKFRSINRLYRAEKLAISCGEQVPTRSQVKRKDLVYACKVGLRRIEEVEKSAKRKKRLRTPHISRNRLTEDAPRG